MSEMKPCPFCGSEAGIPTHWMPLPAESPESEEA